MRFSRNLFKQHARQFSSTCTRELAFKKTYFEGIIPFRKVDEFTTNLESGERCEELVRVAGRIHSIREAGSKLLFLDLIEHDSIHGMSKLQVVAQRAPDDSSLRRGDIVGVSGLPGKTKRGQSSVFSSQTGVELLAPCEQNLPKSLQDGNLRIRKRSLDMIVRPESVSKLISRSKIIRTLRESLVQRGFIEVETPILWGQSGGAMARPFTSDCRAISGRVSMRIAPELFLKQLVIGGMHKVFEIGRVFRNEGLDATHNVEFTMCEFYQAFSNYEHLMGLTEELLKEIGQAVDNDIFSGTFHRIDIVPRINMILKERKSTLELPLDDSINHESSLPLLKQVLEFFDIQLEPDEIPTNARILDKVIGQEIEPLCQEPTFLLYHPVCMSPLAKQCPDRPGFTQRFELFIRGNELCNAYSELNDPAEQRLRFSNQQNDEETPLVDEQYCETLELGLPPTAGWGIGIDRLCMLLTDSTHIREVLAFPLYREDVIQNQ